MRGPSRRIMENATALPETVSGTAAAPRRNVHRRPSVVVTCALAPPYADLLGRLHATDRHPVRCSAPRIGMAAAARSKVWGETIVPCNGATANRLRLAPQEPVRTICLTSGPSRRQRFGSTIVKSHCARADTPIWMAEPMNARLAHG